MSFFALRSKNLQVSVPASTFDPNAASGSVGLVFGQSGTITGAGALSNTGEALLISNGTTTLTGAGVLSGTAALAFGTSATGQALYPISATVALAFSQSGTVTGAG